jgi:YrbI family 3-deoxy-D-manno-octulosonate 8-phosphate phosphatase
MLKLPNTINTIITDFDGILTDNFVYISENSLSTRKLNYKDITGCFLLKQQGYRICIISGEKNPAIEWMRETFDIQEVHQRIREKLPVLKQIIDTYNLSQEDYIYIGDDINDLDCLNYAKYKITVPNATAKVKEVENIQITNCSGGDGAFREVADCLTNI